MTAVQPARRALTPLLGALAFLLFYLAVSPVAGAFATQPLPMPGAPAQEVHDFFTGSGAASVVTGVLQMLSVAGLTVFVSGLHRIQPVPGGRLRIVGWLAVLAMVVSSLIAIVLGTTASALSPETVVAWRQMSFYAGGVVHVVALGGLALAIAVSRMLTRPVRVMAWVAAVPAVLSVASLFWYYASILLPAGRLLAMIAFVVAGVSLVRRRSTAGTGVNVPR